jgi:hypothetical protein
MRGGGGLSGCRGSDSEKRMFSYFVSQMLVAQKK